MPTLRSTLEPGAAIGGYVIEQLLGHDGRADLYLARDLTEHRRVTLKIPPAGAAPDPGRRQRLLVEGRLLQSLRHPHICSVYEVGEAHGRAFLAMEYVEGETLRELASRGPLSVPRVIAIALQLASALEEARRLGVVHRDLKGSNIIVMPSGDVKILDFGLATFAAATDQRLMNTVNRLTDPGLVFGTAEFLSPEQALGQDVDHRSDLFSFGVLLYELLTGVLPFTGGTKRALFGAIVNAHPASITDANPGVSPALAAVVLRLLEKNVQARYQSARHVCADLEAARPQTKERRIRRHAVQRQWFRRLAGSTLGILAALAMTPGVHTLSAIADEALENSTLLSASVWAGTDRKDDLRPVIGLAINPSVAWISNEGRIIFGTRQRNGARTLWASSPGSPAPVVVARQAEHAAVTPDGRAIFFSRFGDEPGLYRTSLGSAAATRIVAGQVDHPVLSPDGRTVMFARRVREGYTLWAVPAEGGDAYPLSALTLPVPPIVSPDLSRLAIPQAEGVLVCDAPHCTHQVRLPVTSLVAWTPDGLGLAHTGAPGGANIWVTRISDGALHQITRFTDQIATSVSWSPDGRRLTVTRQRTLADLELFKALR